MLKNTILKIKCNGCNKLYYPNKVQNIGIINICRECKPYKKKIHKNLPYLPSNKPALRKEIFRLLGNKCVKCGFNDFRALEIDHVNNDGAKERKKFKGQVPYKHILKKIQKGSKDYQILCANHNKIKEYEYRLKLKLIRQNRK